jgi:hypothetical protein
MGGAKTLQYQVDIVEAKFKEIVTRGARVSRAETKDEDEKGLCSRSLVEATKPVAAVAVVGPIQHVPVLGALYLFPAVPRL